MAACKMWSKEKRKKKVSNKKIIKWCETFLAYHNIIKFTVFKVLSVLVFNDFDIIESLKDISNDWWKKVYKLSLISTLNDVKLF